MRRSCSAARQFLHHLYSSAFGGPFLGGRADFSGKFSRGDSRRGAETQRADEWSQDSNARSGRVPVGRMAEEYDFLAAITCGSLRSTAGEHSFLTAFRRSKRQTNPDEAAAITVSYYAPTRPGATRVASTACRRLGDSQGHQPRCGDFLAGRPGSSWLGPLLCCAVPDAWDRAVEDRRHACRHPPGEGHQSRLCEFKSKSPDERWRHALFRGGRRRCRSRALEKRWHGGRNDAR